MRREQLSTYNGWCAWLASPGCRAACDAVAVRLTRLLGGAVTIRAEACGVEDGDAVRALAEDGPFSLAVTVPGGGRAVLVSSRLFPSVALRRIAGSDRLAVSHTFCRAALELASLHAAAAWSAHTGHRAAIDASLSAATAHPASSPHVRARVCVDVDGERSDLFIFIPALPPPAVRHGGRAAPAAVRAGAFIDLPPLMLGHLRGLAPGDLVVAWPDGVAPRAALSIDGGDGAAIEHPLDGQAVISDGALSVAGAPVEVMMNDATVVQQIPLGPSSVVRALDGLRLPARLEVAAFEIAAADLALLAPGQVLECRADLAKRVKLHVCGTLFAEGIIETHEGFHGFRVETVL